ncbi:MAG: NAD(P)-dependent oxidoreductase [Bacteroidia bacterium]
MSKILIIDEVHECLLNKLHDAGIGFTYRPDITRKEILHLIPEYVGVVVRLKTEMDSELLSKASNLKFIARAGVGLDNIDTKLCDSKGIDYFNAAGANANAVGEQAVGMLLSLLSNIVKGDREVRQNIWNREANSGIELKGKTLGIVGYGNTGRSVARKLKGFEVKTLAYDKYLKNYSDEFAAEVPMERIFDEADIITFHVPLTAETKWMVNGNYLDCFRKKIFLLNLSRGKILKTADLVDKLKSGKILGCALDVLENENPGGFNEEEKTWFAYLKNSDEVVLTPHCAGLSDQSFKRIAEVLADKITAKKI